MKPWRRAGLNGIDSVENQTVEVHVQVQGVAEALVATISLLVVPFGTVAGATILYYVTRPSVRILFSTAPQPPEVDATVENRVAGAALAMVIATSIGVLLFVGLLGLIAVKVFQTASGG